MSSLNFADTHNMVAFLEKLTESAGFEQIVDFLNASSIRYALTVNPTIYTSCIKQFWATAKVKTVNGEVQIQALVDGKKVIITESTVRRDLQLEDADGTECLPNATIFKELTRMGTWMAFEGNTRDLGSFGEDGQDYGPTPNILKNHSYRAWRRRRRHKATPTASEI
ncbi:hypothetical protein Tco_0151888 [Tanacetum coccineum]